MATQQLRAVISLMIALTSTAIFAQDSFQIVASKGSSALIVRPTSRQVEVGDKFLARRRVNGQVVDVAEVRVALIDRKYCGVKIDRPLADTRLRKGDFLSPLATPASPVDQSLQFLETIDQLDKSATDPIPESATPPPSDPFSASDTIKGAALTFGQNDKPAPVGEDVFTGDLSDILGLQVAGLGTEDKNESPPSALAPEEQTPAATFMPGVAPAPIRSSYLGFSVAAMMPISKTASRYATGPQFGLQALTDLGFATNVRLGVQYTLLRPEAGLKTQLAKSQTEMKSSLLLLNLSIQPQIINQFILDLGIGYYRQHDELTMLKRISTDTHNAIGTVIGLGYSLGIGRNGALMLLGTGNFYFLEADNATFITLLAGYFLSL